MARTFYVCIKLCQNCSTGWIRLILPRHLPAADNSVARGPLRELLPGVALARGWLRHAQAAHDLDGCFALPLPLGGAAAVRAAEPFAELCALASTAVPGHRPAPLPAPPQRGGAVAGDGGRRLSLIHI